MILSSGGDNLNWIDFNILCIGARKPKIYENNLYTIDVMNTNPDKAYKCYINHWDVINRIQGIWYELWTVNNKDDFIINSNWKIDMDLYGYQLFIDKKERPFFQDIFNFYIANSPIKKIIVLFRHQGYESGYIENNMSVNVFLDKFVNKEIYGNIAYILSN